MYKGSLVSIDDLSVGQIENILDLAKDIEADRDSFYGLASKKIMGSLFLEPSTRTRGSFEAAMKRLGGSAVTVADPRTSSVEKGETLADTIRIWSGYSDFIVLRHPWEGAARLAADYSDVPVINAGDGGHEHPTQTLLDLYTLRKEFGTLEGRKIVLCGDLKNGRTVHSLVYALLRFGSTVICLPGEGLGLPEHVVDKIETEYGIPTQEVRHAGLSALYSDDSGPDRGLVDAIYMTPTEPHSLTLFGSAELQLSKDDSLAFYVTRRQAERDSTGKGQEAATGRYPRINAEVLKQPDFSKAVVLHPLPRVDEISTDVDTDSRSKYFEQARNGVPVRMALIALMLGLRPWRTRGEDEHRVVEEPIEVPGNIRCDNPSCAVNNEPASTTARFTLRTAPVTRFICCYCERAVRPSHFAYSGDETRHFIEEFAAEASDLSAYEFYMDAQGDPVQALNSSDRKVYR